MEPTAAALRTMPFEPGHFRLSKAPLAMVLAQFTLQRAVSSQSLGQLRESLRSNGLERLTKKRERSVSFTPASINPVLRDSEAWILLDSKSTKGVSVADKAISCFTSDYTSFSEFSAYHGSIATSLSSCGSSFEATTVALRYVNVFDVGDDPTTVVTKSLGGLNRTGIGKEHHHHNYEFWCDTDYGRLALRFSTTHGDRKPAQLGHAEVVFPTEFLKSYDDLVGHLDICANTKTLSQPANWAGTATILEGMNLSIEQAFLNAINEDSLVSKFEAKAKQ